jgi:RNA polymerase sigma factor (sigma-70 family)
MYTRTAADADDVLQEIAFALWRALPTHRGDCSERTFVFRVAHNRGATYRKRAARHPLGSEPGADLHDPRPAADEVTSAGDRSRRLRAAIAQLPDTQQQVVLLRLEGLTDAEIGAVVGISDGNVGVRLTRARKALRNILGDAD